LRTSSIGEKNIADIRAFLKGSTAKIARRRRRPRRKQRPGHVKGGKKKFGTRKDLLKVLPKRKGKESDREDERI